jgi:hypothetical protein
VIETLSMFNQGWKLYGSNADCVLYTYSSCFSWKQRAAYVRRRSHGSGELVSISVLNELSYQYGYDPCRSQFSYLLAMRLLPVRIPLVYYQLLSVDRLHGWQSVSQYVFVSWIHCSSYI